MVEMYGYVQPISRNIEIHILQMFFICYSFVKRVLHFSFIQDAFLDAKKSAICWPETASIGSPVDLFGMAIRDPFQRMGGDGVAKNILQKKRHSTSNSPRTEKINYVHTPAWNRIIDRHAVDIPKQFFPPYHFLILEYLLKCH